MKKTLFDYDINLLKCLHILLEERCVKTTANRLSLTPSAISKSLNKLRDEIGDPLFIRSKGELIPTLQAELIGKSLNTIFEKIESCYLYKEFNKKSATGHIKIAATEQFSVILIPRLLSRLRTTSPNLVIESLHLEDDYETPLSSGAIDFSIQLETPVNKELISRPIYAAAPIYWGRADHPLTQKEPTSISLADIISFPQIAFRYQNVTQKDYLFILNEMKKEKLEPKVILDTNHLLIALISLLESDALMMAPDYFSLLPTPTFSNQLYPIKIDHIKKFERLTMNIFVTQLKKTLTSPLHNYIYQNIVDIFKNDIPV